MINGDVFKEAGLEGLSSNMLFSKRSSVKEAKVINDMINLREQYSNEQGGHCVRQAAKLLFSYQKDTTLKVLQVLLAE